MTGYRRTFSRVKTWGWRLAAAGGLILLAGYRCPAMEPAAEAPEQAAADDDRPPPESPEEFLARRAKLERAAAPPYLFRVDDPATGKAAYLQGVPTYYAASLYPVHPRLQAALDAADFVILPEPVENPDEEAETKPLTFDEWVRLTLEAAAADIPGGIPPEATPAEATEILFRLFATLVPDTLRLPPGKRLPDMLPPDLLHYWIAGRDAFLPPEMLETLEPYQRKFCDDAIALVEGLKPDAFVFLAEAITNMFGNSRDATALRLDQWAAQAAADQGKAQGKLPLDLLNSKFLPILIGLYREAGASPDNAEPLAATRRLIEALGILTSDDEPHPVVLLMRREYDAWFDNDRAYPPPDPEKKEWLRTRVVAEWRRLFMSRVYADLLREAMDEHKTTLMMVPMICLADQPDSLPARLAAKGLAVAPVGP